MSRISAATLRRERITAALAVGAMVTVAVGATVTRGAAPAYATDEPAPASAAESATPSEPQVAGLIVKTSGEPVSYLALAAASEDALADASAPTDVSIGTGLTPTTRTLAFDAPVSEAEALAAARKLEARPDVLWAEPDRIVRPAVSPDLPNDALFDEQWDVWDAAAANGGYSVKAPLIWETTTGSASVVVAVVDTGITSHPDLNANVVTGYDMVSRADIGNDGNGRDGDPADPGDWLEEWETRSGIFREWECEASDSSWHGTHVAGTIAAVRGNGIGVSGVAPGVRIQAVRAMGRCGGLTSDVAAAIRWAAGGSIPGVPANATPAKVINLSLGSTGSCSTTEQEAIDFARGAGATVVVAAGNETAPVSSSSPANCSGVITVAATGRNGALASYSNYGQSAGEITLSAPGGDSLRDTAILSTYNTGRTSPGTADYASLDGTSMAAPHVAAGAALAYSLGATGPDQVAQILTGAVQPFPSGVSRACTISKCGAGILDLSRLVAPEDEAPEAPTGVTAVPGDAAAAIAWTAPVATGGSAITGYVATAQPGGAACQTATTACTITGLVNGTTYTVSVTATNAAGLTSAPSTSVTVTPQASGARPGIVGPVSVTYRGGGRNVTAYLKWTPPAGGEVTEYRARLTIAGRPYGGWTSLTSTRVPARGLWTGYVYRVQIQAGLADASGTMLYGPSRTVRLYP